MSEPTPIEWISWAAANGLVVQLGFWSGPGDDAFTDALQTGKVRARLVKNNGRSGERIEPLSSEYWRNDQLRAVHDSDQSLEVEFNRQDIITWLKPGTGTLDAKRGGRPPLPAWKEIFFETIRLANLPDGLPDKQADLERHLLQWASNKFGDDAPKETAMGDMVRELYRSLGK